MNESSHANHPNQQLQDLQLQVETTNQLLQKLIKRRSLFHSFALGLLHSLGATVGLAVVLALIAFILSKIELVPLIGGWLSQIIDEALSNVKVDSFLPY